MSEPLSLRLVELLNPPTGVVALAAAHLESGRARRQNERVVMLSASLIKLPILATFWEAAEAGRVDPSERVTVPPRPMSKAPAHQRRWRPGFGPPGEISLRL